MLAEAAFLRVQGPHLLQWSFLLLLLFLLQEEGHFVRIHSFSQSSLYQSHQYGSLPWSLSLSSSASPAGGGGEDEAEGEADGEGDGEGEGEGAGDGDGEGEGEGTGKGEGEGEGEGAGEGEGEGEGEGAGEGPGEDGVHVPHVRRHHWFRIRSEIPRHNPPPRPHCNCDWISPQFMMGPWPQMVARRPA